MSDDCCLTPVSRCVRVCGFRVFQRVRVLPFPLPLALGFMASDLTRESRVKCSMLLLFFIHPLLPSQHLHVGLSFDRYEAMKRRMVRVEAEWRREEERRTKKAAEEASFATASSRQGQNWIKRKRRNPSIMELKDLKGHSVSL